MPVTFSMPRMLKNSSSNASRASFTTPLPCGAEGPHGKQIGKERRAAGTGHDHGRTGLDVSRGQGVRAVADLYREVRRTPAQPERNIFEATELGKLKKHRNPYSRFACRAV